MQEASDNGGWARREKPKAPPPVEEPPESWGALPDGPCPDCQGRYAHEAVCPTGVEEEARRQADPQRIAMIRRVLGKPDYCPHEAMLEAAREYDHEDGTGRLLRHPGRWNEHYLAVAKRVLELLPEAERKLTRDGSGGVGETALQYLSRVKLVPGMKPQEFKRGKAYLSLSRKAGEKDPGLFDEESIAGDSPHI